MLNDQFTKGGLEINSENYNNTRVLVSNKKVTTFIRKFLRSYHHLNGELKPKMAKRELRDQSYY